MGQNTKLGRRKADEAEKLQYIARYSDKPEIKARFDAEVESGRVQSLTGNYKAPDHIRAIYSIVSRLDLFNHDTGSFDMGKVARIQKFLQDDRDSEVTT